MTKTKPFIVGICGGSGSGKTYLANMLAKKAGEQISGIIEADSYYRDLSHLTLSQREKINFDHPDALELCLLTEHLSALKEGNNVEIPVYDFTRHTRTTDTLVMSPCRYIFVEGLMIFTKEDLTRSFDFKVFIDVDPDIRFIRRLRRDINSRGRSVEKVIEQYMKQARPMHEKFIEPGRSSADLILSKDLDPDDIFNKILAAEKTGEYGE